MTRSYRFHRMLVVLLLLGALACQTVLGGPTSPTAHPSPSVSATSTPTTPTATLAPNALQERHERIFQKVWNLVRDRYVYADYNGVDWEAIRTEFAPRVRAATDDASFWALMDEMIQRLNDEHSVFLTPEEVAEEDASAQGHLDYVGIGVLLSPPQPERDYAVVLFTFPNSPAEQGGLRAHERILEVNGMPVVYREKEPPVTDALRGPAGTTVTVTVQMVGEAPRVLSFTRARIQTDWPIFARVLSSARGEVGYVLIPTFFDETIAERTRAALEQMTREHQLIGLILDLRINGGGAYPVLEDLLAIFAGGKLGSFVNRQGEIQAFTVKADPIIGLPPDVPLVILVSQETVSYAEVFSGSLQAIGRAYLIGTPTAGNVESIYPYDFEDGSRLWLAEESYLPVTGERWEGRGVQPDLVITQAWEDFASDADDLALQAALTYLSER